LTVLRIFTFWSRL